jgi:hypothetical protein
MSYYKSDIPGACEECECVEPTPTPTEPEPTPTPTEPEPTPTPTEPTPTPTPS